MTWPVTLGPDSGTHSHDAEKRNAYTLPSSSTYQVNDGTDQITLAALLAEEKFQPSNSRGNSMILRSLKDIAVLDSSSSLNSSRSFTNLKFSLRREI